MMEAIEKNWYVIWYGRDEGEEALDDLKKKLKEI